MKDNLMISCLEEAYKCICEFRGIPVVDKTDDDYSMRVSDQDMTLIISIAIPLFESCRNIQNGGDSG